MVRSSKRICMAALGRYDIARGDLLPRIEIDDLAADRPLGVVARGAHQLVVVVETSSRHHVPVELSRPVLGGVVGDDEQADTEPALDQRERDGDKVQNIGSGKSAKAGEEPKKKRKKFLGIF